MGFFRAGSTCVQWAVLGSPSRFWIESKMALTPYRADHLILEDVQVDVALDVQIRWKQGVRSTVGG